MIKIIKRLKEVPETVKISVAYTICSILQKCLSFITLPLFARILTTEEYGQYSVYTSWSGILAIFVTLNLAYGSFSTAMTKFDKKREQYIASVEGLTILMALIFFCIYFPFHNFWNKLFEMPTNLIVILIIELVAQSSLLFWSTKKRFEFKYKSVVAVTLFISVMSPIVAYFLICSSDEKGYARIIGYAIINIVVGLFFLVFNIYKGKRIFDKQFWKYALNFNIPLIPYYLSQVVFNQSDRIMISKYCGTGKAAIYSVAYTLAMILTFVLNAINNSYVPWFYGKIKEKKESENKQVASAISVLMAFMLLGIIWVAPEIIYIMAGEAYSEAIWIVPPVAMSLLLLFYSQLFINVAFYYEQKGFLVKASVIAAIVNIVLNAIFIPIVGYIVAGYTTLISYIIFAILNYVGMKRNVADKVNVGKMYDLKELLGIFIIFLILSILAMVLYNHILARYVVIFLVFSCLFVIRDKILSLLKQFKN